MVLEHAIKSFDCTRFRSSVISYYIAIYAKSYFLQRNYVNMYLIILSVSYFTTLWDCYCIVVLYIIIYLLNFNTTKCGSKNIKLYNIVYKIKYCYCELSYKLPKFFFGKIYISIYGLTFLVKQNKMTTITFTPNRILIVL